MAPNPESWSLHGLAARWSLPVTDALPQRVLTLSLRLGLLPRGMAPINCPIPIILAFLQERFDSGRMPPHWKCMWAAINSLSHACRKWQKWPDHTIFKRSKKAEPSAPFYSTHLGPGACAWRSHGTRCSSPYNQRACERFLSRQRSCSRWPLLSELETCRRFQLKTRVLNSGQVIADSPWSLEKVICLKCFRLHLKRRS